MNLDANSLVIVLGVFLLLIGIVGGGFELKELKIPKVGSFARGLSVLLGLGLVGLGMDAEQGGERQGTAAETVPGYAGSTPFVEGAEAPAAEGPRLVRVEQPTPAEEAAVDEHREVVVAQLNAASDLLRQRGYTLVDSNFGAIDQDAAESFSILLEAGYQYGFVAACDNDCDDIDLQLTDGDGEETAGDFAPDGIPVIEYHPDSSATFTVTAYMAHCDVAPCRFGIGVFRK